MMITAFGATNKVYTENNAGVKKTERCVPLFTTILRRKMLKALVVAAEAENEVLSEELMTAFAERLTATHTALPEEMEGTQYGYKVYSYAPTLGFTLPEKLQKLHEFEEKAVLNRSVDGNHRFGLLALHVSHDMLAGGTGLYQWEAGFVLSEFIFSNTELFKGRRCVELGCGVGMAGVAAARAGAARVLCTDGDAETLENCKLNLRLNNVLTTGERCATASGWEVASVHRLQWEDDDTRLLPVSDDNNLPPRQKIDVVFGADLTYDPLNVLPLLKILKKLLGCTGSGVQQEQQQQQQQQQQQTCDDDGDGTDATVAYIATTKRTEATYRVFTDAVEAEPELVMEDISQVFEEAASTSSGVQFCHVVGLDEDFRRRIVLHKFTRRA